ncbi:TlpA family protein disulfide reductase [Fuerstiella marisgermanici]|uniref:Cytochrome c biogenesis protein TlpA n=1 Tax=Fuerstiella marisgermanici TaxID=1891926 RepID=A0A1P8WNZ4_9PLAN|nr:TlpA disulfide reductase family protein [Fuerstiella marisgermanici]APZ95774.1 Cytochrome c biogenesis protein TlpA [Fuerstiella marisgermanici]
MSQLFNTRILMLVTASMCLAIAVPTAFAQETKPADKKTDAKTEAKSEAATKEDAAESPLFEVPEDGSVEELFDFISKVKRTRSKGRARAEQIEHLKLQIAAIVKACEKIREADPGDDQEVKAISEQWDALTALKMYATETGTPQLKAFMDDLNADKRPQIKKLIAKKELLAKAATVSRMSAEERDAFLDELFAMIDEDGLDRATYSVAHGIGRSMGSSDTPEVGAKLYERLAMAMEKSDDPEFAARAEKTRGAARRLRLPGEFMELTGTTAEGEPFDWSAYRGKVVLVDFWASWCGPCRAEIPNMKTQLENYGDKGFAIVGINLDQTKERYQQYVDKEELTWTNLMSDKEDEMGWDNPIATHYGISGIPTAILVDKDGKVVSMRARGGELNAQLEKLLGPVEKPDADEKEDAEESS